MKQTLEGLVLFLLVVGAWCFIAFQIGGRG